MGRQLQFHILPEDCRQLLKFIHQRDPVIVTNWTSELEEALEVQDPCSQGGWYCLWNQALLPNLKRRFVPDSIKGPYYRVDSALPTIEFSYPAPVQEL